MAEAEIASPDFTVDGEGSQGKVACMGFSPDGTLIAVGFCSSKACWIINMAEQKVVEALTEGHEKRVSATAFSPDGEFLATGSDNIDALIWRVRDWKLLHAEAGYTLRTARRIPVAWGPNSDMLVKLLVKRGEDSFHTFLGPDSFPNVIATMACSPDGKTVAACDRNGNLNIYAINLGIEAPLSLVRRLSAVQQSAPLFFTPDGSALWVVKSGLTIRRLEGDVHTQKSNFFDKFVDASVAPGAHTLVVCTRADVQTFDLNDLSATRTALRISIQPGSDNIALSPTGDIAVSVENHPTVAVYRGAANVGVGLTKAAR